MNESNKSQKLIENQKKTNNKRGKKTKKVNSNKQLYLSIILFIFSIILFSFLIIYTTNSYNLREKKLKELIINQPNIDTLYNSYYKFFNSTLSLNKKVEKLHSINGIKNDNNLEFKKLNYFKNVEIKKLEILSLIDNLKKKYDSKENINNSDLNLIQDNINNFYELQQDLYKNSEEYSNYYKNLNNVIFNTNKNLKENYYYYNEFFHNFNFLKKLTYVFLNDYQKESNKIIKNLETKKYKNYNIINEKDENKLVFSNKEFNKWKSPFEPITKEININENSVVICYVQYSFKTDFKAIPHYNKYLQARIAPIDLKTNEKLVNLDKKNWADFGSMKNFSYSEIFEINKNYNKININIEFKFKDMEKEEKEFLNNSLIDDIEKIELKNFSVNCNIIQKYNFN